MKKIMCTAVAVLAFSGISQAPAQASGGAKNGEVSIGVIGEGLRVKEIRALLDGWEPGAQARVSLWQGGRWVREVRGWKYTSSEEAARYRYELAAWKMNTSFPHKSQLCVEFKGYDNQRACLTIQR
ncbi:hypothetical protein [Streptomyces sp. MJM1172]|uniref:hypothetical protein n=1 Tax=Streptomyces sp. MJM1172 TaxID=1703926 RepID=UPI00093F899B|nr:hypothetical protein [Streptomyces sp. MJM1172]OKI50334.1 hypothetical protein AMK15_32785 [Streptomyces sp. MJM1172]